VAAPVLSPDAATTDAGPPSTARSLSLIIAVATFVVLLAAMVARNTQLFTTHIVYDGDFAANAILIDKARHFQLLVGNYSRVGFNHPGPAFLYCQAWSELLFRDLLHLFPEPYNAQAFGMLILNAALLGAVGYLVHRHTRSVLACVIATAVFVLFIASMPATIVQPWMPYLYIAPFLLFLVASSSVLADRARSLPLFIFAGGLLVHGHVSFVAFVGLIGTVVIATEIIRHRHDLHGYARRNARPLTAAAVVLGLFLLPIVVNLILHWPGELAKYYDFARDNQANRHGLRESLRFVASYWPGSGVGAVLLAGAAVIAGCVLTLVNPLGRVRAFCFSLQIVSALATVAFVQYAITGVDYFQFRYVGYFYLVVPAVIFVVPLIAALTHPAVSTRSVVTLVLALAAVVVAVSATRANGFSTPYRGDATIPTIDTLLRDASRRHGRGVALDFTIPPWPTAVGALEYGRQHGLSMCVDDAALGFLVTTQLICNPQQRADYWQVKFGDAASTPAAGAIYADPHIVVVSET
jgi:hypothetical protein